jgi:hypothetical protein
MTLRYGRRQKIGALARGIDDRARHTNMKDVDTQATTRWCVTLRAGRLQKGE